MPDAMRVACRRPVLSPANAFGLGPFGILLLMVLVGPAPAQRLPLPPNEQEAVNHAIDRGVAYLKQIQHKNGTWPQQQLTVHGTHPVGYAALPGLTLLECGVPAGDPVIQKTAQFLRSRAARLDTTYELSLALLFLDRLGDPKDEKIIQTFALRLIAGQSATGGWGYRCPLLNLPAQKELLTVLRHLDPPMDGVPARIDRVQGANKKPAVLAPVVRAPGAPPLSGGPGEARSLQGFLAGHPERWRDCLGLGILDSEEPAPPEPDAEAAAGPEDPPAKAEDKANGKTLKPGVIPERLRMLPVVQDPDIHVLQDPLNKPYEPILTTTDNSNTQFAILALWTAQRHDVPMKRTMNLIVRRYVTSQNPDGTWGYYYRFGGGDVRRTLTMTCVGLIGLAVGHGLAKPKPAGQPVQDPRIINGLIALSKTVGQPKEGLANPTMENLYYLWSLERVAVLYNLPTIGDKDWYRWGAQILVANQDVEGHWSNGLYIGNSPTIDTCLALLFLKRSNLVKDLTAKLPFTGAELNDDIMRQLAPPPKSEKKLAKTLPPVEPPRTEEPDHYITKPPPASTSTVETDPADDNTSGGKKKWIVASLILFVAFAGGGLFLILFAIAKRKETGSNADSKPKVRKKRKLQSAKPDG